VNARAPNVVPAPGHPGEFEFNLAGGQPFVLEARLRSNGDYGVNIGDPFTDTLPPLAISTTFCAHGVLETKVFFRPHFSCAPITAGQSPFLTLPVKCSGTAPATTARVNSWQEPGSYASMTSYASASSAPTAFVGQPTSEAEPVATSFVAGCANPELSSNFGAGSIGLAPDTTQADAPAGASFALKLPQVADVSKLATPELKDATVTLPAGMTADPSAANGLQACTEAQFGLNAKTEPAEPADCPAASQVGTVMVKTPLLESPVEGQVFIGEPECSPCSATDAEAGRVFRLFVQADSTERGVIVKLAGRVSANPTTGRLQATFTEQPQLPFSELELKIKGGSQAPLATPQACGKQRRPRS
jgi:hypothetical protein